MDSDYSIEQGLIGDWISTDKIHEITFTADSRVTWYTENDIRWDGTYKVNNRDLSILIPPYIGPVFKVNMLTSDKLSITGTGRYYFTNQILNFTKIE